jgi:DNA-binding transcriptional ArsR family regulator
MDRKEIGKARGLLASKENRELGKILRVLCGPSRLSIIILLKRYKNGLTVTDLAKILNSSLSKVSHQLAILRRNKFVEIRSRNRETVYGLADHRMSKYF